MRKRRLSTAITEKDIEKFRMELMTAEKCRATIESYIRSLRKLKKYLASRKMGKEELIRYKEYLKSGGLYKFSSINTILAALNRFCEVTGYPEWKVKALRLQGSVFRQDGREMTLEDYLRLIRTAMKNGKERLALIIQTMGSTGIRVSELKFITVESLEKGMAEIDNKGKIRIVVYPEDLQKVLKEYTKKNRLTSGTVFCTRFGNPVDRSNLWREMRGLCREAKVDSQKVFPHNLRHLFAQCFYELKRDIARLADVLGHSSIETTRLYIQSTGEEHKKCLDTMKLVVVKSVEDRGEGDWIRLEKTSYTT